MLFQVPSPTLSPESDFDSETDVEVYLVDLKLDLPENITGGEEQDEHTLNSARTEDDVSSDIFDEDFEYLDDLDDLDEVEVDGHVTTDFDDDCAMVDDTEAQSMRTGCDVVSDIFDEVTDDKAEIFDVDFDEVTDGPPECEISQFMDDSAKTDCDVSSNIFEEVFDEKVKDAGKGVCVQRVKLCNVLFNKGGSAPRVFM